MVVISAVWLTLSAPWRFVDWTFSHIERFTNRTVSTGQRKLGRRNALLLLVAAMVLFGLGLMTGIIDCSRSSRACIRGFEFQEGALFAGFAVALAIWAIVKIPRDDHTPQSATAPWSEYRASDWRLGRRAVARVAGLYAFTAVALQAPLIAFALLAGGLVALVVAAVAVRLVLRL